MPGNSLFLTCTINYVQAGLLFSVLITAVLTVVVKDAVGRPRPDFFWLCFPDGVPVSPVVATASSDRAYLFLLVATNSD